MLIKGRDYTTKGNAMESVIEQRDPGVEVHSC